MKEITQPHWHSRGYLPHFDCPNTVQHVTFRLADSLPAAALTRMEGELFLLPEEQRDPERRKSLEELADAGHGSCILRRPDAALLVQSALLMFDGDRYRMLAWVVMPNHVHALMEPLNGWTLGKIVWSWKSFTGRRLAPLLGNVSAGRVWHREYWDRFVRNADHFRNVVEYIHWNPVKAGLARSPQEYEWSSAGRGVLRYGGE